MSTRVVVTGAAGFIGSHLVDRLVSMGHDVVAVDNFSTGKRANLEGSLARVELIGGDLRDPAVARTAITGASIVYHQAALPSVPRSIEDPRSSHEHNIDATLNVLLAARDAGVSRVVYAGSSSAYGNAPGLPRVETMPASPLSPYAVAKFTGELYAQVFHRTYGIETVTLRYFNVFGPRQDPSSAYAAVIPRFASAMLAGHAPTIFGDGQQTRDFTYVENVIDANIRAASAPADRVAGEVFNIGCGERITVNELAREVQVATGSSVPPIHATPRPGDVRDSLACIEKARTAFGYEPRVRVREGIPATVEWLRSRRLARVQA